MTEPRPREPLVGALERIAERQDRGAMSALRRSLSVDAVAQAYPYVVPFLPSNPTPWLERAYLLVAGLFALHPKSGERTLATALRAVRNSSGSQSIEARFVALLNAHPEDLGSHLRHAVALVRTAELAIDWHDLLRTVRTWNLESTRRHWARDFWAASVDEGETE